MSVNWQEIITTLGATVGGGGALLAASAWFMKAVLTDRFARDAEAFKSRLKAEADIEIERLKNSLQMAALEHQVRFSNLHERRAQVIADVYGQLVDLFYLGQRFVLIGASPAEQGQREEYNNAMGKIRDFTLFFEARQIYLPERVCALLATFLDELKRAVIPVGVYGANVFLNDDALKRRNDTLMKAFEAFEKEIPAAKRALEIEFRTLLGEQPNILQGKEQPLSQA